MRTPASATAITHSWVEFLLQNHENRSNSGKTVQLTEFNVVLATKPGESFNAELVRLDAKANLKTSSDNNESANADETKSYNFIAKFLSQDPFNREMVKRIGYHTREYYMYSQVIPELNRYGQENIFDEKIEFRLNVPLYIYGICNPKDYVLVMENCKVSGFETNDKHKGLDLDHALLAVNHVARLHALSYCYNKATGEKFLEKYPCFEFSQLISNFFKPLVLAILDNAIKYVKSLEGHEEMYKKLEKGKLNVPNKFNSIFDTAASHPAACLTHGDFWNSNLMYRYSSSNDVKDKVETIKLIDWQISQWSNPTYDLHYLINTSTTAEFREDHLDAVLRHYHETFTSITECLKHPVPNWSYEEFYAEYDKMSIVGFMMGLCLIQGTLSKAGEKVNPNSMSSLENRNNPFRFMLNKVKSAAAKAIIPMAVKPSAQFIMKASIKKMFEPILQELLEGKNTIMNTRLEGLLHEADRKGLLDELCAA